MVAGALAFIVFALVVSDFDARGREFVVLAALRLVMLCALYAVAARFDARTRLLRWGLVAAGVGAVVNVVGALGAVVTDGWWFEPFADGAPADPPWYAYVIGLSAIVFAIGTLLVGIAAQRAGGGAIAVAVILGAVLYFAALPLGALGHVLWAAPWLGLGVLLVRDGSSPRT